MENAGYCSCKHLYAQEPLVFLPPDSTLMQYKENTTMMMMIMATMMMMMMIHSDYDDNI